MKQKRTRIAVPDTRQSTAPVRNGGTQDNEKLFARWERKLERFGLGVLPLLCQSEGFTRLRGNQLDKHQWYETLDDTEQMEFETECFGKALQKLFYRERNIVLLYSGIGDGRCYTFKDIGYIFQITQTRAHQLYWRAMGKLAGYIINEVVNHSKQKTQH